MDARLANVSESGARVLTPQALAQGVPVKVEWGETLLLGEVRYSEWANSHYAVGLDLEHALYDLPVLARLANELLGHPIDEPFALADRSQFTKPEFRTHTNLTSNIE
jgi:hypothetical protein